MDAAIPATPGASAVRIDSSRCSRARVAMSSCRDCVDACPRAALNLVADGVDANSGPCDECGLCAGACPAGAITIGAGPLDAVLRRGPTAFVACVRSGAGAAAGRRCTHAIEWRAVAALHDQGVREIVVALGDCEACECGPASRIDDAVARIDTAMRSRGRPGVVLRRVDGATWRRRADIAARGPSRLLGRRAFLRRLFAAADARDGRSGPSGGVLGGPPGAAAVHAYVPAIDAERCDGCDACTRLCPTGALAIDAAGPRIRYRIDASRCDGCRICTDVCVPAAVTLDSWTVARQRELPLLARRCPSCGLDHHATASGADTRCPVCTKRPPEAVGRSLRIVTP